MSSFLPLLAALPMLRCRWRVSSRRTLRSIELCVALVMGNERDGVGEDIMSVCGGRVRVPMRGFIESLNVSVTAAILLAAATQGREGDLPEADRLRLYARGIFFSVEQAEMLLRELA